MRKYQLDRPSCRLDKNEWSLSHPETIVALTGNEPPLRLQLFYSPIFVVAIGCGQMAKRKNKIPKGDY